jgi:hemoglobin
MNIARKLAVALILVPLTAGVASAQEPWLYHRLGGYDRIAVMLDEFGAKLATEEQLKRYFQGHSKSSAMRQRQLILDLFCQITGGPCYYIGRDLKVAHGGLGITKSDWDLAAKRFIEVLNKYNVGEREQKEIGALMRPLEKDIVEKP